jgi:steroid delta-isomerase-like uncharacterized protein
MTQVKTETLIKSYYAAFNAQNVDAMLNCLGSTFVHDVSQGQARKGKKLFRAFLEHMNTCYHEKLSNIVIMSSKDGKRAAAEFDLTGRYIATDPGLPKAKGQKYKLRVGTFFEIKRGKIARVTTHYNMGDWKRQVIGA